MANESRHVYQEYEDALNKTNIQLKHIGTDGSATYNNITGAKLQEARYAFLVASGVNSGKVYHSVNEASKTLGIELSNIALGVTSKPEQKPTVVYHPIDYETLSDRIDDFNQVISPDDYPELTDELIAGYCEIAGGYAGYDWYTDGQYYMDQESYDDFTRFQTGDLYIGGVFSIEAPAGNEASNVDGTEEIINNLLTNGFIVLVKVNGANFSDGDTVEQIKAKNSALNIYETNIATDTNLQEVTNDIDLKKAEAKYEADMRKINQKDKKFDTDLAAMDNERNAIKTEMETLKSVAKENVDRTFKLFS